MRSAHQLSLYVPHHRAKQGHLVVGGRATDVQSLTMESEWVLLSSHCHSNRLLLIIAGSYPCPPSRGLVSQLNHLIDVYKENIVMRKIFSTSAFRVQFLVFQEEMSFGTVHITRQSIDIVEFLCPVHL